ncbi:MAG: PhzF family phenazine biosynthesis protein [Candidatus Kariarchaeaceae archaeon]|jgi:PhzF family phenazine biosynthesis protein
MTLPLYIINAFTKGAFTGNPAAVVLLESWLDDDLLQKIAMQNNLSETAFFVRETDGLTLRWFTPIVEVDLCGHATLATAYTLFSVYDFTEKEITFQTRSVAVSVQREDSQLVLDFPTDEIISCSAPEYLSEGLGQTPSEVYQGRSDFMCVFESQNMIQNMNPHFHTLAKVPCRGVIVTAPGEKGYDFVSRGFFSGSGVDEDPATGSAHTTLTPYWSSVLNKKTLSACQLSKRRGYFSCTDRGSRTLIKGHAELYLKGRISI